MVWGAPEGVKLDGRKEKAFIGRPTKLPLSIEKDWLISKIADKIIPLPLGIRVQLVPATDGQVAVFEVDESPYAPHQTSNIYHMRIDGQNKPAPHHYIEALFRKISFPRLEAYIKPGRAHRHASNVFGTGYIMSVDFIFCNFSPFLNEEKFYYRIIVAGGLFQGAAGTPAYERISPPQYGMAGHQFRSDGHNVLAKFSLFYAEPHKVTKEFYFSDENLASDKEDDKKAAIILTFGGKDAPLKVCRYEIDFSSLQRHQPTCRIIYENKLMSTMQGEKGVTEAGMLGEMGVLR